MTLLRRCGLLTMAAATFGACSTTATITRRSDPPLEAKIVRGTPVSVIVVDGDSDRAIARDEIVDIDHPGNVSAVAGGLLSAYGLFNIAVGAPLCDEKGGAVLRGRVSASNGRDCPHDLGTGRLVRLVERGRPDLVGRSRAAGAGGVEERRSRRRFQEATGCGR